MSFTVITKPTQGKPTRKSLADALIDNDTYLNGRLNADVSLINGSFENDADSDGTPDNWTKTLFTGGTFLLDTTDGQHGAKSVKFTSPGGVGNGGGYLHSDDFIPCSPNRQVEVLWEMKSSVAGVRNIVSIYWYKADQTASATPSTSIYDEDTTNPTSWTKMNNAATPPSDARFFRLRLIGCSSADSTAGSTWFDNVQTRIAQFSVPAMELITATGTWTCPMHVFRVRVRAWGGGGGGGTLCGGGGGGYGEITLTVTPGTDYTVTIGAGGPGAGGGAGTAGGNTSFDALLTVNGGSGGSAGAGAVAGGAGSGTLPITGGSGFGHNTGATFSRGGDSPAGGQGGVTGAVAGIVPGGGGAATGAGADGRILLEY